MTRAGDISGPNPVCAAEDPWAHSVCSVEEVSLPDSPMLPRGNSVLAMFSSVKRSLSMTELKYDKTKHKKNHTTYMSEPPARSTSLSVCDVRKELAREAKYTEGSIQDRHSIVRQRTKELEAESPDLSQSPAPDWILKMRVLTRQVKGKSRTVVQNPYFDLIMGLCVLLNAAFMVVEYEADDSLSWDAVNNFFLIVFTLELSMRLFVCGTTFIKHWIGSLDFFVCFSGWLSLWLQTHVASEVQMNFSSLQILKLLRVVRCVRMLRMLTCFRDLWLIVTSFFECLTSLMWMVMFMIIILFFFGMFGFELIGQNRALEGLYAKERFGRPTDAMLVLFQLMTLDDWMVIVRPCFKREPWTFVYFLSFIGLGSFATMNLVTAVVVESSVKKVRDDREYQKQMFTKEVDGRAQEIRELWRDLSSFRKLDIHNPLPDDPSVDSITNVDHDQGVVIECDAFVQFARQNRFLREQMTVIGMESVADYVQLFHVLDNDGNGSLELHEIVRGVLKLHEVAQDKDTAAYIRVAADDEKHEIFRHYMMMFGNNTAVQIAVCEKMIEKMVHQLEHAAACDADNKRGSLKRRPSSSAESSQFRIPAPPCLPGRLDRLDSGDEEMECEQKIPQSHPMAAFQSRWEKQMEQIQDQDGEQKLPTGRSESSVTDQSSHTFERCLQIFRGAYQREEATVKECMARSRAELLTEVQYEGQALRTKLESGIGIPVEAEAKNPRAAASSFAPGVLCLKVS